MSTQYDHINNILNLYREGKIEDIQSIYMRKEFVESTDIYVGIIKNGTKTKLYIKIGNQETIEY